MLLQSSIFRAICFIWIGIILITIVKGEYSSSKNASISESEWKPDRSKRALFDEMPRKLKIRIKYRDENLIDLVWIKQTEHLANQHLPVVSSDNIAHPDVMKNVGEFVVYYDLKKCSAVVYFRESNTMLGYIGLNYFIVSLPFTFDETGRYQGVVGEPYVIKRIDAPNHIFPSLPDVRGFKRPFDFESDFEAGPSHKRPRVYRDLEGNNFTQIIGNDLPEIKRVRRTGKRALFKQFYLEILVFVAHEITDDYIQRSPDAINYLEMMVKYCITYFSGVDMMFRKLQHDKLILYINLAKIVIEDGSKPLKFIRNQVRGFSETVQELRQYLTNNRRHYAPDSFDQVFLITRRPIGRKPSLLPETPEHALYEARKLSEFHSIVPIAIVHDGADYAVAVHEISRTLNIKHDLWDEGSGESYQCSSIMQEGSSKCRNCLKWTIESEIQFLKFFRENRNRCFLGNSPRSLRIPGPSTQFGTNIQCVCFGYESAELSVIGKKKSYLRNEQCVKPLRCMKRVEKTRLLIQPTVRPFDGTSCHSKQVCWDGQCVWVNS